MAGPLPLLLKACKALDQRQKEVAAAERWYDGEHPIPEPPHNTHAAHDRDARIAFNRMARLAVTNFLQPVVDVPASKLRIEGFHFGVGATASDKDMWEIWQRNHMDADADLAVHAALRSGQSYALVWLDRATGQAEITLEDASQAIVLYEPGTRRRRKAGLKRWVGDDDRRYATLYLPDGIWKYRSSLSVSSTLVVADAAGRVVNLPHDWEPYQPPGDEAWPVKNPYGEVPLFELRVNGRLKVGEFGGGRPQFHGQINDQRRINHTVMGMLVAMEHQSFRQRWVTGWGVPTDEAGNPDQSLILRASASSLMIFEDGDGGADGGVKVGEFSQADFSPFLTAIDRWVKVIASTSGTPPYAFLLGDMINVAADPIARIDGIQATIVLGLARELSEAFEDISRFALKIEGNPKHVDMSSEIIWADPEIRTATEQAGLAKAKKDLGVPLEEVFATLPGVSQQQASRWVTQLTAAQLLGEDGDDPRLADAELLEVQARTFGTLWRSGVDPAVAAERAGLTGMPHTGAVSVATRMPEEAAEGLEDR